MTTPPIACTVIVKRQHARTPTGAGHSPSQEVTVALFADPIAACDCELRVLTKQREIAIERGDTDAAFALSERLDRLLDRRNLVTTGKRG